MKVLLRNRYYCDCCKKSGAAAGAMKRHEAGCTLNPNRVCGMCVAHGDLVQAPMSELKAALLEDIAAGTYVSADPYRPDRDVVATTLRELCGNCPACILAAIRQTGGASGHRIDFDYKKETEAFWSIINDAKEWY